jgi:TPR repeat protein
VKKAAEQSNPNAQYQLGLCYYHGKGVSADQVEAFKWRKKAADQGVAVAQYSLGCSYMSGKEKSVEKNEKEGLSWYTRAAEQGNADAQYELGQCYFYGLGTSKNDKEAFKWTSKSADQGNQKAEYNLGASYLQGIGTPKNETEAFKWYKKAADKGIPLAQYNLGVLYQKGIGVEKNDAEALTWFTKSADQGNAEAKKVVSCIKGEADAKRMLKDIENKETVRKEKVGNRWLANILTRLKERYEQTAEQMAKRFKQKSEIDSYIFTYLGIIGLYSYHFDLKNGSFINCENIPQEDRYDDGTALPQKVYFKNERYEPEKKEYNANVVFEKSCLGRVRFCKYKIIFDKSLSKISSGNVQFFDSSGNLIRTKAYGSKLPKEINYTRYGQSSTNPQQNP